MAKRTAVGLSLVLSAALVLVFPSVTPAAVGDLSSTEICALFPQDDGFTFIENPDPATPSCQANRGDCDLPTGDMATCVSGVILLRSSPEEARDTLFPEGSLAWSQVSGFGESAVEYPCDPQFWCETRFQRDRFWVSTMTAPALGMAPARDLAAHVDQEILRLLDTGTIDTTHATEPTVPDTPAVVPSGTASGLVDVFLGSAPVTALLPDISRVIDCHEDVMAEVGLFGCPGAAGSYQTIAALDGAFTGDFPNPTQRQIEGLNTYAGAVLFAGLNASDGTDLFPSIRGALPLIKRLDDPVLARRFVELLAARDAANWEDRYP